MKVGPSLKANLFSVCEKIRRMTLTSAKLSTSPHPPRQPRWYRLYFLIAGFDILTVCISMSMNHRLMDMYASSVETNSVWADRLSKYANLNALATQTNAPGNDVFKSRNPDEASTRLDITLAVFSNAIRIARKDLLDELEQKIASNLTPHLDRAEIAMGVQVAEARDIFTHIRTGDLQQAGERMAAMDHAFCEVSEAVASIVHEVQRLQHQELETQAAIAVSMRRVEYVIAALIAIMIALAVWYGYRLAQRAKKTDSTLRSLAREAQEHASVANRNNEELTEALAQIESQKRAMNEHSIVVATDPSGNITYANDKFCEISKYSREELIGQDHRIINSGHHSRAFFADLWTTIAGDRVWRGEVCNRAKDGSKYWLNTTIVPFKNDAGRITQYVACRTDITEQKRTEEALRKSLAAAESAESADRAKSDFLANMSHEIRTPMTAILGFAENMLDPDQSEPERLQSVHTIRQNGEFLLGIINDILDLSKIEAGKITVENRNCQPCDIVAEVSSLMSAQAGAKGLPFIVEYVGKIPETIVSDATRLRQILINLVGNAIKFTKTGEIRLAITYVGATEDPSLQFDVIDSGRGMTQDQQRNLFQPFMQADTSTTREFGGTGLGLAISKRFAELLGGDVIVVKTGIGTGTTFRATVATGPWNHTKMLEDPTSATVVAPSDSAFPVPSASTLQGCRILLAEDNLTNQVLVAGLLRKVGACVTKVKDGKLALDTALAENAAGNPFDCILMDMQMPVMDGYEATETLREAGYINPIIALTAHAMEGDRKKCIEAGCDDYTTKPINRTALIAKIHQQWLANQNAQVPTA